MTPTIEPGAGAVVAELEGAVPDGPGDKGLLIRRDWLMIGAAALCLGGAFMALLIGVG
ncbi:MAG: hypothetical protein WAO09_07405 [Candidatus Dormiibacterota bacterium]